MINPGCTVDRNASVFCVLEMFHTGLEHRDIFAAVSDRWSDPRAGLLTGARRAEAKTTALGALELPEDPDDLLARHTADLDAAWRAVSDGIVPDGPVGSDADGRLHVARDDARDTPPSLIDLRNRPGAMLPGVDLPEVILEVMTEYPAFAGAFTAVSGGNTRLADLHVSIAALLTVVASHGRKRPVSDSAEGGAVRALA
ncbi:hypothetical protein [Actinoplanes sp. NBRC 101535]|uniref:hypothetical protein n=1 Tax=Actinoplanes sp. NBRC 101535 TaxID=3032196 RepID=UPI0024A162EC|nr:hypothetical protein [Actinoplanes sp. NBRC 101535]GLY02991.1 hypothetical protein Acsp01_33700 [Actinoplanes sp. NBRC 101535]